MDLYTDLSTLSTENGVVYMHFTPSKIEQPFCDKFTNRNEITNSSTNFLPDVIIGKRCDRFGFAGRYRKFI